MRSVRFFAGALCVLATLPRGVEGQSRFQCSGFDSGQDNPEAAAKVAGSAGKFQPSRGRLHALVIFAGFPEEVAAGSGLPTFADRLFEPWHLGSFSHFYDTMSFGQLTVRGTVLSRRYASDRPAQAYLAREGAEFGRYGEFVLEILRQVDADVDLARFDNDGPDGLPDSGDDDGVVDYVFVILKSIPKGFVKGAADGVAGLGFKGEYLAQDMSASGGAVRVNWLPTYGATVEEGTFSQTVGSMAHEFGHSLGLPDLYDLSYIGPDDDSAGIGRWGLMGWGAHGWNGDDGPNPFSAWSLEQLGWIGRGNERLLTVEDDVVSAAMRGVRSGGMVYAIALQPEFRTGGMFAQDYLLLERRTRDDSYYDRNLPGEGLLIWHVRPVAQGNGDERQKLVDLVCADGLYTDAGHPLGIEGDSLRGGDNLDFWAHDEVAARSRAGNKGDSTDPFDGVRYRRFERGSNPSVDIGGGLDGASTGYVVEVQREGEEMRVQIRLPRWSGSLAGEVHWLGSILVDGDVIIEPGAQLILHGHTQVRIAGQDGLKAGLDPNRCELRVEGRLHLAGGPMYRNNSGHGLKPVYERIDPLPPVLEAMVPGDRWYGIVQAGSGQVLAPTGSATLRDALHEEVIDYTDGWEQVQAATGVREESAARDQFRLLPNYPNPFNATTTIAFDLPQAVQVRVAVVNAVGQTERVLADGYHEAGSHRVVWDGTDGSGVEVASGVHWVQIQTATGQADVRAMLLAR